MLIAGNNGQGKALKLENNSFLKYAPGEKLQAVEKTGEFTFECWFFREEEDEHGFLVRHNGSFAVRIVPWDPSRINIGIFSSKGFISLDSEPCLKAGVWQHVAVVFKKDSVQLWVDGNMKMKKAIKAPAKSSKYPVVIGAALESDGKKVIGLFPVAFDSVRISAGEPEKAYFNKIAAEMTENFEAVHTQIGMPPECNPGKTITEKSKPMVSKKQKGEIEISNSFYTVVLQTSPVLKIKRLYNKFTGTECFSASGSPLFA